MTSLCEGLSKEGPWGPLPNLGLVPFCYCLGHALGILFRTIKKLPKSFKDFGSFTVLLTRHHTGGVRYNKPPTSARMNNTRNTKKKILPASHNTAPVKGKPRKAATRAMIKNKRAKRNMFFSFKNGRDQSCRFRQLLRAGTLAPFLRALDRPMAIACLRLLTGFPDLPLFSLPR